MFYTYHNEGTFLTSSEVLTGWAEVFEITEEQEKQIRDGAMQLIIDGVYTIVPVPPRAVGAATWEVPPHVTAAQIRQWLIDHELEGAVNAAFDNPALWPDEKTRLRARARWEYETIVRRDDALVRHMAALLQLTDQQFNQAFIEANNY